MRFDEKPKRRSLHFGKSRAELSRGPSRSSAKKSPKFAKPVKATSSPKAVEPTSFADSDELLDEFEYSDVPAIKREKPMKLPEDYDEEEPFLDSLNSAIGNRLWIVVCVIIFLVAAGFFTGTIQKIFSHDEENTIVSATDSVSTQPRTIFTQGKFDLNVENTDAGVDIICETITDENGVDKKTCRAKTEEDRKKEEEEKELEEQEKKAKEEREKEEQEDKEAKASKRATVKLTEETPAKAEEPKKEDTPAKAIGITSIAGCPAEATPGSIVILKANVLPLDAANQSIIWSTTSSANVVYDGDGHTATISVSEGSRVVVTAMTVDGGYSEHCIFSIVSSLTQ